MTGIVILAAGGSSRLGRAKQTLMYDGKTLLENAIQAAANSICKAVVVVVAPEANNVTSPSINKNLYRVKNENWKQGIGTSIKVGIEELLKREPSITNAIVMLCDQPYVSATLLNALVKQRDASKQQIIACAYDNTIGVPALFHKTFFASLLNLHGDEGAKKILLNNISSVATIPFPLGSIDIDTSDDYEKLIKLKK